MEHLTLAWKMWVMGLLWCKKQPRSTASDKALLDTKVHIYLNFVVPKDREPRVCFSVQADTNHFTHSPAFFRASKHWFIWPYLHSTFSPNPVILPCVLLCLARFYMMPLLCSLLYCSSLLKPNFVGLQVDPKWSLSDEFYEDYVSLQFMNCSSLCHSWVQLDHNICICFSWSF